MSIELPNLDDTSYKELIQRMVESIPKYSNLWTDFNYSDPGITILELLCWLAENLQYRINYIPIETYVNFLQLLAGASGAEIDLLIARLQQEGLDQNYLDLLLFLQSIDITHVKIEDLQAAALKFLQQPYLAVTEQDYINLTLEANRILADQQIARVIVLPQEESVTVICVVDQVLELSAPKFPNELYKDRLAKARTTLLNTHVSKTLAVYQDAYQNIIAAVKKYLEPRQLLGTTTQVQKPIFTPVNIKLELICDSGVEVDLITQTVAADIQNFLSPIKGGVAGSGWEYNQAPTIQSISHLVMNIVGILSIKSITINFLPTLQLNKTATLGIDALLGSAPIGMTEAQFFGLPQIRLLDILVEK